MPLAKRERARSIAMEPALPLKERERAFEDGEVVVIGDEPVNTIKDRRRRRLLCRGAKVSYSPY
jgi:hypothetical protein